MTNLEHLSNYDGTYHLVVNPISSKWSHKRARDIGGQLLLSVPHVDKIETLPDRDDTMDLIASKLRAGDVIISAGGDGTDNLIVDTLLRYPGIDEEIRKTPNISDRGGNANMGAEELTPRTFEGIPVLGDIIRNGYVADSHPLHLSLPEENQKGIGRLALYFSGLGITGASAQGLHRVRNNPLRKNVVFRNIIDGMAVLKETSKVRKSPIDITEYHIEEGRYKSESFEAVTELCFVNGQRMAKIGYFPCSLNEQEFFKFMIQKGTWPSLIKNATKMRLNNLPGETINSSTHLEYDYQSTLDREVFAQVDGDGLILPNKGRLKVAIYPQAYRSVTTKKID